LIGSCTGILSPGYTWIFLHDARNLSLPRDWRKDLQAQTEVPSTKNIQEINVTTKEKQTSGLIAVFAKESRYSLT
jgi:hypothetical protein